MKNKKLLVLVLAAFSATAVGAVVATGCEHEHSYTWQSSAEGHWQECDCGEKRETEKHVDVKNNSTDASDKDGKCDVCDYEIKQVVTFVVGDHGTAPAAQEVSFGGKATKPVAPIVEGLKISGWYKDQDFENEFDFDTDVINDNTVLYALWVEDDTPGASAKYPLEIELNAQNLKPLGAKGYNYYKFTATDNGRYTVGLGMSANSKKCYFTTDLDEFGVAYGNGQTSSTLNFDLKAGDSVTVKISCAETLAEDATVSVIVSEATGGDALPADAYLSGLYLANAGLSFTVDRSTNKLTLGETACDIDYVGGEYAGYLTFTANSVNYKLSHNEGDSYVLSGYGSSDADLKYFAQPATPIALSEFSGIYEPEGVGVGGITKFNLDENGGGAFTQYSNNIEIQNSVYNTSYNYLTVNSYVLMLNTDGEEVSLIVYGTNVNSPTVYTRTGDHVPTKLPLGTNGEYEGDTYKVREQYGSQYWGTGYDTFTITAYDKEANTYTISVNGTTYKLVFEGENNTVIKLYEENGETLLDTLVKFVINYKNLPTTSSELTLEVSDFQKSFSYYTATSAGWYSFTCTDEDFEFYYNMDADDPTNTYSAKKINFAEGTATVYLEEGSIVGITTLFDDYYGKRFDVTKGVTFSVAPTTAPKGLDQSNPYELNGVGQLEDGITLPTGNSLFVKFTPSSAGSYLITVNYSDWWGNPNYQLLYTVNGTTVGYDNSTWSWYGGLAYGSYEYKLIVSDTNPVWIIIQGSDYSDYSGVKVTVALDYRAGATEPTFTDSTDGDTLTKTASVSGGSYLIADTLGSDLVVTSSSAFTATVNGLAAEVTEVDGVYTLTVPAGKEIYVSVSSAVTFTLSYEKGTEGNPIDITLDEGGFTYELEDVSTTYFVFTQGGTFTVDAGDSTLKINGQYLEFGSETHTVSAGDVLSVESGFSCNLVIGYALPSDILKGNYSYTDGGNEVLVTIGANAVTIGGKAYSVVGVNGNTISLKAEDGSTETLTVTGDTLSIGEHELAYKPVFDADQVGTYESGGRMKFTLTLNADGSGSYSAMGTFNINVTDNGDGTYTFEYAGGWDPVTFSFNEDGNIVLTDSNFGNDIVFEKKDEGTEVQGGQYVGTLQEGWWVVTITLNEDMTLASIKLVDGYGEGDSIGPFNGLAVTQNGGIYSFNYGSGFDASSVTFTVNADGSLEINEQWYGIGTLIKQ